MSGNLFDDLIGNLGTAGRDARPKPKPKPEKAVPLHGHRCGASAAGNGGHYYVRAADVAALLEANDMLPGVAAKLREADQ